jgi:hypothetical protein
MPVTCGYAAPRKSPAFSVIARLRPGPGAFPAGLGDRGNGHVWQGGVVTTDIRTSRYQVVSRRLAGLNDADVMTLLARTSTPTVGFGGTTSTTTIDGVPVFVKRVPLTDLERRPENAGSTANLFGLPNFYQYGIGSTGFGVWRELAVHTMTTRWVLERQFAGFPLLYHWRGRVQTVVAFDLDGSVGQDARRACTTDIDRP